MKNSIDIKKIIIIVCLLIFPVCCEAEQPTVDMLKSIETTLFGYDYTGEQELKRIERIEKHVYGQKKTGTAEQRLKDIQNDTGIAVTDKGVNPKNNNLDENNKLSSKDKSLQLKESDEVDYPIVDKMEQILYKTTYKKDNIYDRLDRLEDTVFQKRSTADLYDRVDKLAAVVAPAKKKYSDYGNYSQQELDSLYSASGLPEVNAQTVDFQLAALEQDILRTQYPQDNISHRLNRLEQKIFSRTYSTDNDITRVQRLTAAYDAKKTASRYDGNRRAQNMATVSQLGGILLMILAILL